MSEKEHMNNEEKCELLSVDEVIEKTGEFGRYQIIQLLLLASTLFITSIPVLTMYFAAYNPPWQCVANTTCNLNGTHAPGSPDYLARCKLGRDEWEFTTARGYSLVTEFGLYCDDEWITNLLKSIIFVGWAFGAILCGALADRFGRRIILLVCIFLLFISSVAMVFATNVWIIVFLQGFRGFVKPGVDVIAFVLASEIVGHSWRPFAGISLWTVWTIAICLLGLKAYLIREWKKLILVCTLPYIPVLIGVFFIPESIRWLRLRGREQDAMNILRKMGRFNKKPIHGVKLTSVSDNERNVNSTYLDIIRPRKMLIQSAIQVFAWFSCGLVYYGVTFASDDLGGNMYRDYILASLVEFPAVLAAIYFCNRLGRKPTIAYPMFVTAAVLIIVSLIPEKSDVKWLRVVFGMIGKFCIALSFDAIYTWSVELYPTSVRTKGMGALQVAARIGSTAAPWIAKALRVYHVTIPFIVMGSCSLATGILLLWLPETKGKETLETLDDQRSSDPIDDAVLLSSVNSLPRDDDEDKKTNKNHEDDDGKALVINS